MCTAATYKTADFYFGRTLDYEFSYGDKATGFPHKIPVPPQLAVIMLLRGRSNRHTSQLSTYFPPRKRGFDPLCHHRHGTCGRGLSALL